MKLSLPWTATEAPLDGIGERLDEVRTALGHEVDRLAQLAGQMGRDASAQAATVARDTSHEGGAVARRLLDRAAIVGPAMAVMGRQRVRGLGGQARALGKELRRVRLTTEPRRSGTDRLPGIALVGGVGIGLGTGIALMYLLDSDRGKRRRQMLVGRLSRLTRRGRQVAAERANAFANRTVGVMADVRRTVTTGIGIDQDYQPSPAALEEWPEGTRVPVG